MIAGWVVYCLVISTLLALAAWAVEELLTRRGRPARLVWMIALFGSLALPATLLLLQRRAPELIVGAGDAHIGDIFGRVRQRERAAEAQRRRRLVDVVPRVTTPQWLAADRAVTFAIIACIVIATGRVAADSWLLYRGRRRWVIDSLDGISVLRSNDLGPAIVGLIEQRIVVPSWALTLSSSERQLMLTHEKEHLAARDGWFAASGLLLSLAMPWSPAVWWSFRRLRSAIEVDCDRRVLRAFPDIAEYGRLLVDVAERTGDGPSLAITGFSERAAPLARRIRAMTYRAARPDGSAMRDAGRLMLAFTAVVVLALVLPPAPEARELARGYDQDIVLPRGVADSVMSNPDDDGGSIAAKPHAVAAARDLPQVFVADGGGEPSDESPSAGRCPGHWRDPRDGRRMQVFITSVGVRNVVQHGDTAWTRIAATGLYRPPADSAYGVGAHQLLRVGCGAATTMTIAGQGARIRALSDLDSTDPRARTIAAAIKAAVGPDPDQVELLSGRVNIVITDHSWMAKSLEQRVDVTHRIWDAVRDVVGRSAMPETVAVTTRVDQASGTTKYLYSSMIR